jgi:hypothetical protein
MSECCLFVCLRPRSYSRLLIEIYPKAHSGIEADLKPNGSKLDKLIEYLQLYPRKLPLLLNLLEKKTLKDFSSRKIGFVNISLGIYSKLLENLIDFDIITLFVVKILDTLLSKHNFPCSCLKSISSLLFKCTEISNKLGESLVLIEPILKFCIRNKNKNEELLIGLEILARMCDLLAINPET